MTTRRWLVPLLLLSFSSPAPGAGPKKAKAPAVEYGIPRLEPGQIWVSSIPTGLEVRIGEHADAGKVVGRTPVVVSAADAGQFVTVRLLKEEFGGTLPLQRELGDFSARTTHQGTHREGSKETDWFRAITYEVHPKRRTVIALFQPRSLSLASVARYYPPGSSFAFSDPAVSRLLAAKGAAVRSIPQALSLLHRGGKVVLPAESNWLVAEVTAPGVVEVIDLASLLSAQRPSTPERTP